MYLHSIFSIGYYTPTITFCKIHGTQRSFKTVIEILVGITHQQHITIIIIPGAYPMSFLQRGSSISSELLGGGDGSQAVDARGGLPLPLQQSLQVLGLSGVRGHGDCTLRLAPVAGVVLLADHCAFHCRKMLC